jgi:hypothetical protein
MTRDEIIAAWNAQTDYMNTWQHLGEDEKLEWAVKLEREACAKVCDAFQARDVGMQPAECAGAIRARGNT